MLTEQDIVQTVDSVPISPRFVIDVARAIERKVLAQHHRAFEEGKTCRTCAHLDSDAKQDPCAGCCDFARWAAPADVAAAA